MLTDLLNQVRLQVDNPEKGLPEELFLFATEMTPMVNVDLLIRDQQGQILLAWRDDGFYKPGWHVPGGILRLREKMEDRIQRTALGEIGTEVICDNNPVEIVQIIDPNMKVRSHFITFVFECVLPEGFVVCNKNKREYEAGYLKWHEFFPDNMVEVHEFYRKYFKG